MYRTEVELLDARVHRYRLMREGLPLSARDAFDLWQGHDAFRSFFVDLLRESPFAAYRWETPAVTEATVGRPFEFVLLDSPGLAVPADPMPFRQRFTESGEDSDVVAFENLGRDAMLVVPLPRDDETEHSHLGAFVRSSSDEQGHALWRAVGRAMSERIGERPVWLSTAGGGVAWLHVRLDDRPKYYGYAPYRGLP